MKTTDVKAKARTQTDMKTRRLGNSDLFITPVGFGAWAIGGDGWEFGWGEQDDKTSVSDNPAVTGAIVGARSARRIEGTVGAANLLLTDEEIAEIEGKNIREPQLRTAA